MTVEEEIKAGIRAFVIKRGQKVRFDDYGNVSQYGYGDWDAGDHIRECEWVIPEGSVVQEETYWQFEGTFTSNKNEIGLNVEHCHCKCGKYKDVTLRVVASMGEAIRAVMGYSADKRMEL